MRRTPTYGQELELFIPLILAEVGGGKTFGHPILMSSNLTSIQEDTLFGEEDVCNLKASPIETGCIGLGIDFLAPKFYCQGEHQIFLIRASLNLLHLYS